MSGLDAGDIVVAPGDGSVTRFTGSGTWSKPAGFRGIVVECWGSGGGGGGAGAAASGQNSKGGGGGGGGYTRKFLRADQLTLASYAVTVNSAGAGGVGNSTGNNGGTAEFGWTTPVIANGGLGGPSAGSSVAAGFAAAGGAGASPGSGGDVMKAGNPGEHGQGSATLGSGGNGGSAAAGGGGGAGTSSAAVGAALNGAAGRAYGGGGGGALSTSTGAAANGGAGGTGAVVVTTVY